MNKSAPKFQVAMTLSHEVLATTFHHYNFESESPLIFKPGQYISVKVAPDRINCYSIAGHEGLNRFSLLVDILPGGPGSNFFEHLKVGDKINYLGPFGMCTLNLNDGAKHLLFLGTGCGFAPLKSMIETALKENNVKLPITLYLSFRAAADVIMQDYLKKLSEEYPNFNFKITVDKADNSWQGPVGFITELIKQDFPDARECAAYLFGNKFMITDATKILLEQGCPKERIYTEKV